MSVHLASAVPGNHYLKFLPLDPTLDPLFACFQRDKYSCVLEQPRFREVMRHIQSSGPVLAAGHSRRPIHTRRYQTRHIPLSGERVVLVASRQRPSPILEPSCIDRLTDNWASSRRGP